MTVTLRKSFMSTYKAIFLSAAYTQGYVRLSIQSYSDYPFDLKPYVH